MQKNKMINANLINNMHLVTLDWQSFNKVLYGNFSTENVPIVL